MSDNEHIEVIRKIVKGVEADELPRGYVVRQSTTLRTCPADMSRIRRELGALAAELAEALALLQRAHDAMMDWHFAHGDTSFRMDDEEREMGAVCRAIQDYRNGDLDAAPGDTAGER